MIPANSYLSAIPIHHPTSASLIIAVSIHCTRLLSKCKISLLSSNACKLSIPNWSPSSSRRRSSVAFTHSSRESHWIVDNFVCLFHVDIVPVTVSVSICTALLVGTITVAYHCEDILIKKCEPGCADEVFLLSSWWVLNYWQAFCSELATFPTHTICIINSLGGNSRRIQTIWKITCSIEIQCSPANIRCIIISCSCLSWLVDVFRIRSASQSNIALLMV